MTQPDLLHNTPAELAKAFRIAADVALVDPLRTTWEREYRSEYYRKEADRIEREARR